MDTTTAAGPLTVSTVATAIGAVAVRHTPRESRTATILLHGAAGSWTTWRAAIAAAESGGSVADLVVPDLAGWRRERLPTMPDTATIDVVPDWVCEVRSPSTQRHDRFKKMPMYLRHGVGHAWMVDPEAQGIEVFRRTAEGWLLVLSASGDAVVRAEPFDAIELSLASLWAW